MLNQCILSLYCSYYHVIYTYMYTKCQYSRRKSPVVGNSFFFMQHEHNRTRLCLYHHYDHVSGINDNEVDQRDCDCTEAARWKEPWMTTQTRSCRHEASLAQGWDDVAMETRNDVVLVGKALVGVVEVEIAVPHC